MTFTDKLRELAAYSEHITLQRRSDGRFESAARMPRKGYVYSCHVADDPITALELLFGAVPHQPHNDLFGPL